MEDNTHYRHEIGTAGEDIACNWLSQRGHIILERNYRWSHLEIDIISIDAAGIHFVEVKTRKSGIQAPPQDNVDWRKQARIAKAASMYLKSGRGREIAGRECFFDVFTVIFSASGTYETEWFPQAYLPIFY